MQRLPRFEQLIRQDPARRGLIASEPQFGPLCPGHLTMAVNDLAARAKSVALVTGFYIPRGSPPAAETDGPLGTLLLADVLLRAGVETRVITDGYCFPAIAAAATAIEFPPSSLVCYPHPERNGSAPTAGERAAQWRTTFAEDCRHLGLTHLIAIERVGPSHTVESLRRQSRNGPLPLDEFSVQVAGRCENHCHNMRGEPIDEYSGDLHRLFEELPEVIPGVCTIGVGDGANEIGMGSIPWEDLARRLQGEQAGRVPCRVACDYTIVAGVSNWGGYALAAGFAVARQQVKLLRRHTVRSQWNMLCRMVEGGPAVDGVTRRQSATVDGLEFAEYIAPWQAMRMLMGLAEEE